MNKTEFIEKLEKLNLPRTEFVILSGGSLLLRGLRESTADLDITVSKQLSRELHLHQCPQDEHGLYMPFEDVQMMDDMERFRFDLVDGYQCETLEQILEQKRKWNRPKDQKDIERILRHLESEQDS